MDHVNLTELTEMMEHDAGEGIDAFLEKRQPVWAF